MIRCVDGSTMAKCPSCSRRAILPGLGVQGGHAGLGQPEPLQRAHAKLFLDRPTRARITMQPVQGV